MLGYYNRRGIDPEGFLREIRLIASDPDETHAFNVTDEAALKDIVDALGERIFPLEGQTAVMVLVVLVLVVMVVLVCRHQQSGAGLRPADGPGGLLLALDQSE